MLLKLGSTGQQLENIEVSKLPKDLQNVLPLLRELRQAEKDLGKIKADMVLMHTLLTSTHGATQQEQKAMDAFKSRYEQTRNQGWQITTNLLDRFGLPLNLGVSE